MCGCKRACKLLCQQRETFHPFSRPQSWRTELIFETQKGLQHQHFFHPLHTYSYSNRFLFQATKLEGLLKQKGLQCSINPEKPRKGCFEVRSADKTFVSLLVRISFKLSSNHLNEMK